MKFTNPFKRIFTRKKPPAPEDVKHAKYMKWWHAYTPPYTGKKPPLKRVYIDNSDNSYYLITDTLQMSEERGAAIDAAIQASDYNMTAPERAKRCNENIALLEKIEAANGDVSKIAKHVTRIRENEKDSLFRMSDMPKQELLIEIALLLFIITDENPMHVNPVTQNRKRDLVASDDDLRAFFLKTSYESFKATTTDGGATFLRYLEAQNKNKHRKTARKKYDIGA